MAKTKPLKQRVLIISQLYPSGTTGTSVKTRETINYWLDQGYAIDVVCVHHRKMVKVPFERDHLQIFAVERNVISKASLPYLLRVWHLLFTPLPFRIKKMFDTRIKVLIDVLRQTYPYQAILFDGFSTLQYARGFDTSHIYIDDEDITDLLDRRIGQTTNVLLKAFFWLEKIRCQWYEKKYLAYMNQVWAISPNTAARLQSLTQAKTTVMPTIVPPQTQVFRPRASDIVFSGLLSWLENVDGLRWFLDNHWAQIHQACPQTRLLVTGQMAAPELVTYLDQFPNVSHRGFVDDLTSVYRNCALAISPILINSGIKVKTLTYLSYGLPVVSTEIATWGMSSLGGVEVADTTDFGAKVIGLLKDRARRSQLAQAAQTNIKKHHSRQALKSFFESVSF